MSNRGLSLLGDAANIDTLYLEHSQVDADGIPALEQLPKLKTLSLTPKRHSVALVALRNLNELQHLAIFDSTEVTVFLRHLPKLKSLLLREPGEIATELAALKTLRWLIVLTKEPNPQRLRAYRRAAPSCNVRSYTSVTEARRAFRRLAENF